MYKELLGIIRGKHEEEEEKIPEEIVTEESI